MFFKILFRKGFLEKKQQNKVSKSYRKFLQEVFPESFSDILSERFSKTILSDFLGIQGKKILRLFIQTFKIFALENMFELSLFRKLFHSLFHIPNRYMINLGNCKMFIITQLMYLFKKKQAQHLDSTIAITIKILGGGIKLKVTLHEKGGIRGDFCGFL